jgi:hypothetical protein
VQRVTLRELMSGAPADPYDYLYRPVDARPEDRHWHPGNDERSSHAMSECSPDRCGQEPVLARSSWLEAVEEPAAPAVTVLLETTGLAFDPELHVGWAALEDDDEAWCRARAMREPLPLSPKDDQVWPGKRYSPRHAMDSARRASDAGESAGVFLIRPEPDPGRQAEMLRLNVGRH